MAGSILAALNDTPERSAMVQGWATSPVILTQLYGRSPCTSPVRALTRKR